MSLGARLLLLSQQLRSKKFIQCKRCALFYETDQENCPHCTGLSDRQAEELIDDDNKIQIGNALYLVFLFTALISGFALLLWIF